MPGEQTRTHRAVEPTVGARDLTRRRIVDAAMELLERGGREAVTTRAVADAAGLQPPALYRLFGDKKGLLDAVAEYGFARFLATKQQVEPVPDDPVQELRDGWDTVVDFGLTNPALYALMYGEPTRSVNVFRTGLGHLKERIRRIAGVGLLRVEEGLAAQIVHATASGAILTWHSVPESDRDRALLVVLRESMITTITTREPAVEEAGPGGAARALLAALPDQNALSQAEQQLLTEWLQRLSE